MAFVYEVNGQRVEFDREPTDADIDEAARSLGAPAPAAAAGESGLQMTAEPSVGEAAAGVVAPAVTGAAFAKPMGVSAEQLGRMAGPILDSAKQTYRGPMGVVRGVADATLMAHGVPPLAGAYGAAENLTKRAQALGTAVGEASKGLSQGVPGIGGRPTSIDPYLGLRDTLRQAGAADLYDDVMRSGYAKGGNNTVISGLQSNPKFQQLLTTNPEVAAAFKSYGGSVPGAMAQAGRVAGTVARGAGRVLGPVGMGMSMYDAGQMARQTQLGERLAQGQGQQAEQAFRQGPVQSYQGPQLAPQEAQNVMQNASPRDRQYFNDQLNMAIRLKAAKKVLGQP